MKYSVPLILEQIKENMLDKSNPENIRYNYMVSIENIRDFCDRALVEYHKTKKKGR